MNSPLPLNWLLSLSGAFLLLGLTEAVIKPCAKWVVERKLRRMLPSLFAALDPLMPSLIQQYRPGQLEHLVRAHLNEITGEDWSSRDIEPFFRLYDPRRNADWFHQTPESVDTVL
jgi:hypothetical protein